jgi:UPF0755 protein
MRLKYFLLGIFAIALIGTIIIFGKKAQDPAAITDFINNSSISKPALVIDLYNAGLIRNVYALNTVLVAENIKHLLLRGMGLEQGNPQLLANPFVRYIKIAEGTRKEQIADQVGATLNWSQQEIDAFSTSTLQDEGKLYPETYLVPDSIDSDTLKYRLLNRFNQEVGSKVSQIDKNNTINLDTALKIASLIQREAAGKTDMNLISGIIWNRLFKGMNLDIDATLQYAKGTDQNWWPKVVPADKYIVSPYNTYLVKGLPPSPIANPGLAAIEAAFNPQKTSCIFYFHDKNRVIHCSVTYQEHVAKIKKYL